MNELEAGKCPGYCRYNNNNNFTKLLISPWIPDIYTGVYSVMGENKRKNIDKIQMIAMIVAKFTTRKYVSFVPFG